MPSISCREGIEIGKYNVFLAFHFQNSNVIFDNLIIQGSSVLLNNGKYEFTNCYFDSSVIFGMDVNFYVKYVDPSRLKGKPIDKIIYYGFLYHLVTDETRESLELEPMLCISITLRMENCSWNHNRFESVDPIDIPHKKGIQVICVEAYIFILQTSLEKEEIYSLTANYSYLYINGSTFEGGPQGSVIQGGVNVRSFSLPIVIIENCTFSNVRYKDVAYSRMATLNLRPAALRIAVLGFDLGYKNSLFLDDSITHITVTQTVFKQNMRAIALSSKTKFWSTLKMSIEDSIFSRNEAMGNGGAVHLLPGNISLTLTRCSFLNNRAGIHAFGSELHLPNVQIEQKLTANAFNYNIIGGILMLDMLYTMDNMGPDVNKTVSLSMLGSGGAIYVRKHQTLHIDNCTFINNSATSFGGTMFASTNSAIQIKNSIITSGNISHDLLSGTLIQSNAGLFHIENTVFIILLPQKVSAFFHTSSNHDSWLFLTNASIYCPTNSKLVTFNTSNNIEKEFTDIKMASQSKSFKELTYSCVSCLEGLYALGAGSLEFYTETKLRFRRSAPPAPPAPPALPAPPAGPPLPPALFPMLRSKYSHKYNYTGVSCQQCPYGGICQDRIRAKPNYWGISTEGVVVFYRCPSGYCCSLDPCLSYNECKQYRSGVLCSTCSTGYSEALFSTNCIEDRNCNQTWFIPLSAGLLFIYTMFLLFQTDITNILVDAPIGKETFSSIFKSRTHLKWEKSQPGQKDMVIQGVNSIASMEGNGTHVMGNNNMVDHNTSNDNDQTHEPNQLEPNTTFLSNEESGLFLILLFYYFQDSAIVRFEPVYVKVEDVTVVMVQNLVAGLFEFQIDVVVFASNICPIPGLTPIRKVLFKLLSVPFLLGILLLMYFTTSMLLRISSSSLCRNLSRKASLAIMLAILFSYQKLAMSAFSLIYCVKFEEESRLFIQGDITCLQTWQSIILCYICICIIPFGFYLLVMPKYMSTGQISLNMFFIGCLFPLPVVLFFAIRNAFENATKKGGAENAQNRSDSFYVFDILQGPYKEYNVPIPRLSSVNICWSGVLLLRRVALIVTHTYVQNILTRLIIMTFISFAALVNHLVFLPCKERRSNIAGAISNSALVCVCIVNFARAAFEAAEFIPKGHLLDIMDSLKLFEDCLLFWIPSIGASIMVLFLVMRTILTCFGRGLNAAHQLVVETH